MDGTRRSPADDLADGTGDESFVENPHGDGEAFSPFGVPDRHTRRVRDDHAPNASLHAALKAAAKDDDRIHSVNLMASHGPGEKDHEARYHVEVVFENPGGGGTTIGGSIIQDLVDLNDVRITKVRSSARYNDVSVNDDPDQDTVDVVESVLDQAVDTLTVELRPVETRVEPVEVEPDDLPDRFTEARELEFIAAITLRSAAEEHGIYADVTGEVVRALATVVYSADPSRYRGASSEPEADPRHARLELLRLSGVNPYSGELETPKYPSSRAGPPGLRELGSDEPGTPDSVDFEMKDVTHADLETPEDALDAARYFLDSFVGEPTRLAKPGEALESYREFTESTSLDFDPSEDANSIRGWLDNHRTYLAELGEGGTIPDNAVEFMAYELEGAAGTPSNPSAVYPGRPPVEPIREWIYDNRQDFVFDMVPGGEERIVDECVDDIANGIADAIAEAWEADDMADATASGIGLAAIAEWVSRADDPETDTVGEAQFLEKWGEDVAVEATKKGVIGFDFGSEVFYDDRDALHDSISAGVELRDTAVEVLREAIDDPNPDAAAVNGVRHGLVSYLAKLGVDHPPNLHAYFAEHTNVLDATGDEPEGSE